MTTSSYALSRSASTRHLQSRRGAAGAIVLLLALPLAVAAQIVAGISAEVTIHLALATGSFLLASSVFDFSTPRWLSSTAGVAATVLGAIFLLQGLGALPSYDALRAFAYSVPVGGWGEMATVSIVMVWFMAVARAHTRAATMLLGIGSSLLVVGLAIWSVTIAPATGTPQELRLLFLLPIVWFLFVSSRRST